MRIIYSNLRIFPTSTSLKLNNFRTITSNPCNVYLLYLVTVFGVLVALFAVFRYLSIYIIRIIVVPLVLGCFSEKSISIFSNQKILRNFREYLCRPLSGVCEISFLFTDIHQIHQNVLPLTLIGCKITYCLIIPFVCTIT